MKTKLAMLASAMIVPISPAASMSKQDATAPAASSNVRDPDEAAERLTDQFRGRPARSSLDRGSARSVMDVGNAMAQRNVGPGGR